METAHRLGKMSVPVNVNYNYRCENCGKVGLKRTEVMMVFGKQMCKNRTECNERWLQARKDKETKPMKYQEYVPEDLPWKRVGELNLIW